MSHPSTIVQPDDPEAIKDVGHVVSDIINSLNALKVEEKTGSIEDNMQGTTPEIDFPEGGRQAWMSIFGAFLVQFVSFGYINAFGVYQDFYIREYLSAYTPSNIGWIGGMQIFLTFSSGVFVGPAFDRGYFRHLLLAGTFLNSFSLFMLSLSHKNSFYQVFLTSGVGLGLSSGLVYIPSLSLPGHYFKQKRALAIGITSSGSALGAVIHPIILNQLFKSSIGFHNGVRISAGINTFLLICASLTMRTRLPLKTKVQRFPVGEWLRKMDYLIFVISGWFTFLGIFFPVFYIQLAAITREVDPSLAFYLLSILNGASVFGRIIPGHFVPRFGAYNSMVLWTAIGGILILFMVLIKNTAGFVVFAILYGFSSGAGISLSPVIAARLSNHPNEFGTRMGVVFAMSGLIGLFAIPIDGALLTNQYHWLNAGLFSGIFMLVSSLGYATSRFYFAKYRGLKALNI